VVGNLVGDACGAVVGEGDVGDADVGTADGSWLGALVGSAVGMRGAEHQLQRRLKDNHGWHKWHGIHTRLASPQSSGIRHRRAQNVSGTARQSLCLVHVSASVGDAVGDSVGAVGDIVGTTVGAAVGDMLGAAVGDAVGDDARLQYRHRPLKEFELVHIPHGAQCATVWFS